MTTSNALRLIALTGLIVGFWFGWYTRGWWSAVAPNGSLASASCPNVVFTTALAGVGGGDPAQIKE